MVRFASTRPTEGPLFQINVHEFSGRLAEAAQELELDPLGELHPYRLRHTGASYDAAGRFRPIAEIQRRGRWRDPRSLRRYEHGARLNDLLARLVPGPRRQVQAAERSLPRRWRLVRGWH